MSVIAKDSDNNFGPITYNLIGDGEATAFFQVNRNNGEVQLIRSINTEPSTNYRLRIVASDGGTPPKTDTAIVEIQIRRNLNRPTFTPANYELSIKESWPVYQPTFLVIKCKDDDVTPPYNTIKYAISSPEVAKNYFEIEETTGRLRLKQSLVGSEGLEDEFDMRVQCVDSGEQPLLNTNGLVKIKIVRNNFAPTFERLPYDREISETLDINSQFLQVRATDRDSEVKHKVIVKFTL